MKEEIKQRLQKSEIWQSILYMLLFMIIYSFTKFLVMMVMLFQLVTIILTGKPNEQLLKFGQNLSTYIYHITTFLTFNSKEHPFPFSNWPNGAPDKIDQHIEE